MTCKRLAHIILTAIGILGAASCADTKDNPAVPVGPPDTAVNLTFSVAVPSAAEPLRSRGPVVVVPDDENYFESEESQYEGLHTLRVIIVRPDGTVEHNRLVAVDEAGGVIFDNLEFRVKGGEIKKIYLLGNERAVPYDFSALSAGSTYTPGTIENITFSADAATNVLIDNSGDNPANKQYIPMCEVHEVYVKVPATVDDRRQDAGTLFITRAAVKFTFNVTADDGDGLYITDITFNGLADKEYFLPNKTTYNPPKGSDPIKNWTGAADPDLYGRFITDYSIPADAVHSPLSIRADGGFALGKDARTWHLPLYFCESKIIDKSDLNNPFSVSITVAAKDDEGNFTQPYTFSPVPLPNLPILPRNTHVVVNMTLTGTELVCQADLVPYIGIELEPGFGWGDDPENPDK